MEMASNCRTVLVILLSFSFDIVLSQHKESFCGEKHPNHSKTCISVRLPWQEAPIYFCTEKVNIPFKDRCTDHLGRYCGEPTSNTSLLVATPWDCCALTSTPDICADRTCPSMPFNRTCIEIAPDPTRPWECCPTFFCDSDVSTQAQTRPNPTVSGQTNSTNSTGIIKTATCQMKRLEASCNTPPKGKKNCISFKDDFGCCNKFQCEGDATIKQGMCPMQINAIKFQQMMERDRNRTASMMNMTTMMTTMAPKMTTAMSKNLSVSTSTTTTTSRPGSTTTTVPMTTNKLMTTIMTTSTTKPSSTTSTTPTAKSLQVAEHHQFHHETRQGHYQGVPIITDIRCVGDFNCPGGMKCCSQMMSTYYSPDMNEYSTGASDSWRGVRYGATKDKAIYGTCVEPVFMD